MAASRSPSICSAYSPSCSRTLEDLVPLLRFAKQIGGATELSKPTANKKMIVIFFNLSIIVLLSNK
jgi:hypothetical protein